MPVLLLLQRNRLGGSRYPVGYGVFIVAPAPAAAAATSLEKLAKKSLDTCWTKNVSRHLVLKNATCSAAMCADHTRSHALTHTCTHKRKTRLSSLPCSRSVRLQPPAVFVRLRILFQMIEGGEGHHHSKMTRLKNAVTRDNRGKSKTGLHGVGPSGGTVNKSGTAGGTVKNESGAMCAAGVIENVCLLGAPVGATSARWERVARVVHGRIINGYSKSDIILGLVFRAKSLSLSVAGIQKACISCFFTGCCCACLLVSHALVSGLLFARRAALHRRAVDLYVSSFYCLELSIYIVSGFPLRFENVFPGGVNRHLSSSNTIAPQAPLVTCTVHVPIPRCW